MGACSLASSNLFMALRIGWIEMKLDRVILGISPRIGSESDFYGSYNVGNLAQYIATRLRTKQPSYQLFPCILQALTALEL